MFKKYDKEIKKVLDSSFDGDWKKILKNHELMIERIQHERLIHLFVTIFVGLSMTIVFTATVISAKAIFIILDILLLPLFAGYILHYRFLENTTQKWYLLEDCIRKKIT